MSDQVVTLRISGDGSAAITAVGKVEKGLEDLGGVADKSSGRAAAGMARTERSARSLNDVVSRVRREVGAFFGAFASVQGLRALAGVADRYSNMSSQIRLATHSQAEYARAEEEVFAISQRTSTALTSTAELYTRIARSTSEYNVSQERVLRLTETINQTFAVSGAAAVAQSNAITQLTQAFAGGVLRAEEFNSVIEASPRLAQALADGLGVGIGKLRKMVNDGTVDVSRMIAALENQAQRIEEEYSKMPLTIERGWTQVSNALTRYIGQADQSSGASRQVASALSWVAKNIDTLVGGAITLGKVLLTLYGARLLTQAALYTAELAKQAILQAKVALSAGGMGASTAKGVGDSLKSIGLLRAGLGGLSAWMAGWQIGTYLRDQFEIVASAGDYLVYGIAQGWEELKRASAVTWESIKFAAVGAVDVILESFAGMLRWIAQAADIEVFGERLFAGATDGITRLADGMSGALTPVDDFKGALAGINAEYAKNSAANDAMLEDMQNATAATFAAKGGASTLNEELGKTPSKANAAGAALKEAAKAAAEFAKSVAERVATLQKEVATFGKSEGAVIKYEAATQSLTAAKRAQVNSGADAIDVLNAEKRAMQSASDAMESLVSLNDDLAQRQFDLAQEASGADEAQKAFNVTLNEAAAAFVAAGGAANPAALAQYAEAIARARTLMADTREFDRREKAVKEWERQEREAVERVNETWGRFADAIAGALTQGGNILKNLGRALVNTMEQIVTDLIAQWLRTKIIGMFAGGGGGWGALIGMGAAALSGNAYGGSGGGSATSTATNTALNFATNSAGGGNVSLFQPSSWMQAGRNLYNGFFGASQATSGTSMFGSYTGAVGGVQYAPTVGGSELGLVPNYGAGAPGAAGPGVAPGSYTYTPNAWGYAAAGVAGAYAGYQRWQGSNKDVGGALGGVAYGVGTYGLALGAGAALTGGMAAGLAAIPVVGWIALAAMAVDMLSGGKLFGTKGKLHHSNLSLDVGAEGVSLAQSYTLKGQKAFFGGTKWTTKGVAPSPEAMAAAQEFYAALIENRTEFAKAFNAEVGSLIGGSYEAEYDKKGNLTKSSATVMGVEYKDATQEQFGQILIAENMIDVLSQFDDQVSVLADSVRGDVEALSAYANQYATAISGVMAAIEGGMASIALGEKLSVQSFMNLAREMAAAGETIDQTVQRLMQAQAQYDQFVGQFKPGVVYVDDFQGALAGIFAQMQANIAQAHALARAAGAERAATEDLVAIHGYAAQQFAAALAQLEASAQDRAFALGLTNTGSYGAISAEIERLQARAGAASQPVRDFGDAMSEAADRARHAMDLLLGDLSPLNDRQKLETARGGLMRGSVTQEQFLEIARRLFGTSRQYETEFAFAQRFAGGTGGAGGSGGIGAPGGVSGGLTPAERERLATLLEQQQQMQAAQQLAEYQTLAQQIAEISMAREEDWESVADRMGIDLARLQAGLGLQSQEELDEWIAHIKEQKDSDGANTRSIVLELKAILRELQRANAARDGTGASADGSRSGRTSGEQGSRQRDSADANTFGVEAARRFGREIEPFMTRRRNVREEVRP